MSKSNVINADYKCRILLKKKEFPDKLSSKYSNKIYTIIKVGKNTVSDLDQDEILKVKEKNIKIIPDVYNNTNLKELEKATLSNKVERLNKKDDSDLSNIIES